MTEARVNIRPYNSETDYQGLKSTLIEAGLYDPDYESEHQLTKYSSSHPENIIVAVAGNLVVGSIYLQDSDVIPLVSRLGVRREYRERGIGSRLVQAALDTASSHGHLFVEAWVNSEKEIALAFWQSMGFRRENPHFNMVKEL